MSEHMAWLATHTRLDSVGRAVQAQADAQAALSPEAKHIHTPDTNSTPDHCTNNTVGITLRTEQQEK